ncbi:hypothetical protein [Aliikangiella sp. IMCC44359]|uniref:hypothetical protein n=1 Tax=Aliikangiella sp. IMCC44359 TaxID=3459125 RepID=UPI00403AFFB2
MLSSLASSVDFGYGFFSSINRSDNLNQGVDSISGTAYDIGVRFDLGNEANSNVIYQLDGVIAAADYSSDDIQREYYRALNGLFQYNSTESNFGFIALEELTQVPSNRFSTEETNNLRDINVFAARPSYYLRLTGEDRINFYATYIDFSAGEDSIDAVNSSRNEKKFSVDYSSRISQITTLAIVAEKSETDFSTEFDPLELTGDDYSQKNYFLRWETLGKTNNVRANLGRSEILTDSGETLKADLIELLMTRKVNRTQSLSVGFREGFDNLLSFNLSANQIDVNGRSVDFTTALKSKEKSLSYEYREMSFASSVKYLQADLESLQTLNTEKRTGIDLNVSYSLSRLMNNPLESNVQFNYSRTKSDFTTADVASLENKVDTYGIRFNYSFTRKLDFYARIEKRISDSRSLGENSVEARANSFIVGVTYTPLRRRSSTE